MIREGVKKKGEWWWIWIRIVTEMLTILSTAAQAVLLWMLLSTCSGF